MPDLSTDSKYLAKETRPLPPSPAVQLPTRRKLGEILVERGIITPLTVERILKLSRNAGVRFGTVLEELGLVTGEELANALAVQYNCRIVRNIASHPFGAETMKVIHVDAAVEHTIFPLQVQNGTLALAMADPTNQKVVDIIRQDSGLKVCSFVATREEINSAITRHYLKGEPKTAEKSILLVDDDKLILTMLSRMLENDGYKVLTARDGMEAFKKIVNNRLKLIITDKEMPKFDGYALFDSLKNIPETKTVPVILISASANPDDEIAAYEKGFYDYIAKPVKEGILKAKIRRALRGHNSLNLNFSLP